MSFKTDRLQSIYVKLTTLLLNDLAQTFHMLHRGGFVKPDIGGAVSTRITNLMSQIRASAWQIAEVNHHVPVERQSTDFSVHVDLEHVTWEWAMEDEEWVQYQSKNGFIYYSSGKFTHVDWFNVCDGNQI